MFITGAFILGSLLGAVFGAYHGDEVKKVYGETKTWFKEAMK